MTRETASLLIVAVLSAPLVVVGLWGLMRLVKRLE